VLVVLGQRQRGLLLERGLVETALENGFDGTIGEASDPKGAITGCFETLLGVAIRQADDSEAGPVPLLGVGFALDDPPSKLAGARPGLLRPGDDARGGPLQILLMGLRPMSRLRGVAALFVAAQMDGDPAPGVEDLDGTLGDSHVDLLAEELVRDAVEVAEDLDVVVDVDSGLLPSREFVALLWKCTQERAFQRLEQGAPGAFQLLERPVVQKLQESANLSIQIRQAEERVLSEPRQDPALHQENTGFYFGLVARLSLPGGEHGGPVMDRELVIRGVEVGLVVAGVPNTSAKVVGLLLPSRLCGR
jgi:hypothetical protein